MNQPRSGALEANINVTPLVDVCLVLLIIFMIVMPVLVTGVPVRGVPVRLPKSGTGQPVGDATRQLAITVKDDGTVYLDAIVVRKEQIAAELRRLHDQAPGRPIAVRGDKQVRYGEIVAVLDACRAAGYLDVALVSERKQ